jgi:hypothetical protein
MVQRVLRSPKPQPRFIEPMVCQRVPKLPEGDGGRYALLRQNAKAGKSAVACPLCDVEACGGRRDDGGYGRGEHSQEHLHKHHHDCVILIHYGFQDAGAKLILHAGYGLIQLVDTVLPDHVGQTVGSDRYEVFKRITDPRNRAVVKVDQRVRKRGDHNKFGRILRR